MADFSRRRNHEFLTKLYKHHYVYLMHLIHNWIDSRLPQIYRSIPRVISNIIGNRVKGSILSFEDQDRLFRRGWKKVVSRVSERLNGIIKQEHRHGRDPRKATDRDYDPGAWRRPDPRKESVVLRNNLERICRQETNPPPRHFSRVRIVSTIRSLRSLVPWSVAVQRLQRSFEHASSRLLRSSFEESPRNTRISIFLSVVRSQHRDWRIEVESRRWRLRN